MSVLYKADHIGSFLRPPELLEARKNAAPEELRALEDKHIVRVITKQKELGFEAVTDGELRRRNFMSDFTDAVEGFDLSDAVGRSWQTGGDSKDSKDSKQAVSGVTGTVTSHLRQSGRVAGDALPLVQADNSLPPKIT